MTAAMQIGVSMSPSKDCDRLRPTTSNRYPNAQDTPSTTDESLYPRKQHYAGGDADALVSSSTHASRSRSQVAGESSWKYDGSSRYA